MLLEVFVLERQTGRAVGANMLGEKPTLIKRRC